MRFFLVNKFVIIFTFFLSSCCFFERPERRHQIIYIRNDSQIDIAFYPYSFLPIGGCYPDTLLPKTNIGRYCSKIEPQHYEAWSPDLTVKDIRDSYKKDTLIFFVFSVDTLNKYSWEEIREDYKILKRYDLSISDLDSMNWTIIYP